MDIRKLQRAIVDGLEDVKAQDIVVFNTEHLSPLFERVIIATGASNRQTKALAASVRDAVKTRGMQVLRTEGADNGEWIIVDCGAAVAHIMQPSIREYYHLEEIWGGKSVPMKIGKTQRALPKASEPEPPAKKAPAKKTAPGRAPAKKTTVPGVASAKRAPARKAAPAAAPAKPTVAPRRAAPAKTAPSRPAAAKKAPARKTTAKAGVARKPGARPTPATPAKVGPARKTPAAPAKKAPAKKTPAKKAIARRA